MQWNTLIAANLGWLFDVYKTLHAWSRSAPL
jgi:hypothetical protein